jgi:putative ABC transport system ATP-binding protein
VTNGLGTGGPVTDESGTGDVLTGAPGTGGPGVVGGPVRPESPPTRRLSARSFSSPAISPAPPAPATEAPAAPAEPPAAQDGPTAWTKGGAPGGNPWFAPSPPRGPEASPATVTAVLPPGPDAALDERWAPPAAPPAPAPVQPTLAAPAPAVPAAHDPSVAAQVVNGVKIYGSGDTAVRALDGITVSFTRGQFTAIMGPSGSGKSTLMHCLAALDRLTSGDVLVGEANLSRLTDRALTLLRRESIGFVFQSYNLVPTLTALENITLPLDLAGKGVDRAWLSSIVATLRIGDRLAHKPDELSGGQQQRVAVARALVTKPEIIFADEPTGNLDTRARAEVLEILRDSVRRLGQTVVMVTHDPVAAGYADRAVFLVDGRAVDEMAEPSAERVLDQMKLLGG